MSANPIVEVQNLSKLFQGRPAVGPLDLSIQPGEIVGLLGPNGAGKTTFIHMLLGLILPSSGSIRMLGLEMPARRKAVLQRVNFSSAYVQMPLTLTPRQNLRVFGRLYGIKDPDRRAGELLDRMGLSASADRPTRALSSGQLSRLNLAKSLMNDPELLLLDEPTVSMDPHFAQNTRAILKEIHGERRMTILYTSHNMREIEVMATRVLFLRLGRLVAQGTTRELLADFREDDLEKVFLKIMQK